MTNLTTHLQDLLYPYAPNKLSKIEMDTKIIPAIEELVISMLPREVPPYPVESPELNMLHDGAVQGWQDAIELMEARIKEA